MEMQIQMQLQTDIVFDQVVSEFCCTKRVVFMFVCLFVCFFFLSIAFFLSLLNVKLLLQLVSVCLDWAK